ncbi:hypothetical protein [Chryseobacterium camelliae]|uniref:hypothetical protein n=1 Tax=Chryseobacterium camelliae TaxID=1265445 RepID=UPI000C1CAE40|nr:hypothetical protein [Chryseobacterium camelliae]MDR6517304.1 hypothetical protein [Chryseobacterium camelliae]
MNKHILVYLLFFLIFSCKKEKSKDYEELSSAEYFSIPTNLNNLTSLKKYKINDSIYAIRGRFNIYEITGQVKKNGIRTGWWEAKNYKNKILVARLEYKLIENKEFVNQYVLFKSGKIDTLKSKFYSLGKDHKSLKYRFYMPYQPKKLRSEGNLNYRYSFQGKEHKHLKIRCIKNGNIYYCEIPISLDNINTLTILGNFWEMVQLENGDIVENNIYVEDTLK